MNSLHPIIERVPKDFLLFIRKAEFDSAKFLNKITSFTQKQIMKIKKIQISDSKSDFSNDEIHRRKKRKKRKKFFFS